MGGWEDSITYLLLREWVSGWVGGRVGGWVTYLWGGGDCVGSDFVLVHYAFVVPGFEGEDVLLEDGETNDDEGLERVGGWVVELFLYS